MTIRTIKSGSVVDFEIIATRVLFFNIVVLFYIFKSFLFLLTFSLKYKNNKTNNDFVSLKKIVINWMMQRYFSLFVASLLHHPRNCDIFSKEK